jgi:hypothetical protein
MVLLRKRITRYDLTHRWTRCMRSAYHPPTRLASHIPPLTSHLRTTNTTTTTTTTGHPGEAVSVVMDPSGRLAVCGCSDGAVALYDLDAGHLVGRGAPAHGDVCTGAVLLEDYRGLITVGGRVWSSNQLCGERVWAACRDDDDG